MRRQVQEEAFADPRPRLSGAVVIALASLILVPSSATSGLPFGSYYPVVFAVAALTVGAVSARPYLKRPPALLWLLVFFALVGLTTLMSGQADLFTLLLPVAAVLSYVLTYSGDPEQRRTVTRAVVFLALLEAVFAYVEVIFRTGPLLGALFTTSPVNPLLQGLPRAQGTLGHPIVLGFLLVVGIGILCAKRSRTAARLMLLIVLLGALVTTGSSSGVAFGALIVLVWLLSRKSWPGKTFAAIFGAFALLLVLSNGWVQTVIATELEPRNAAHRLNSITAIPRLFEHRDLGAAIFGQGYGGVVELYLTGVLTNDGFYAIDNQYVTFLVQGGLIGLVVILGALSIITAKLAARPSRRFFAGWIGLLAMGLSFDFMAWYAAAVLLTTYAAVAIPSTESAEPPPTRNLSRARTVPSTLTR